MSGQESHDDTILEAWIQHFWGHASGSSKDVVHRIREFEKRKRLYSHLQCFPL